MNMKRIICHNGNLGIVDSNHRCIKLMKGQLCTRSPVTDRALPKAGKRPPKDLTTSPYYIASSLKHNPDMLREILEGGGPTLRRE